MNLTQEMRRRIATRLVNVTFAERKQVLRTREGELAIAVRDYDMTEAEITFLETVPAKWLKSHGYINAVRISESKSNDYWQLNFPPETRIPNHLHQGCVTLDPQGLVGMGLLAEIEKWRIGCKELALEEQEFKAKTEGVLKTFTTVEKLLESWPTVKDVMPEGTFKAKEKVSVPATIIDTLDEQVRASMKKETPSE